MIAMPTWPISSSLWNAFFAFVWKVKRSRMVTICFKSHCNSSFLANWLSDRRFFWDFIRPACIGSCRQTSRRILQGVSAMDFVSLVIERVEDVSKARSLKEKVRDPFQPITKRAAIAAENVAVMNSLRLQGRTWIKFALMEKKLSELLKLVISDCHLVRYLYSKATPHCSRSRSFLCRKFYHDDSIMASSQAFILCDQLAGLSAIDFRYLYRYLPPGSIFSWALSPPHSFCFKQDGLVTTPTLAYDADIDVIDLTSFLSYKSKQ